MNFYENVRDHRLYNKAHIVNYIVGYICFMNALDGSSLSHISRENVDYDAVNSLTARNFLLDKVGYNHCSATMRYILGRTLGKHFGAELKTQKHIRERKLLLKYSNWPIPLKSIQCIMWKADIITLLILPLNKASIAEIVNILRWLTECLGPTDVVEDKVVPIKGDFLTMRPITRAIYRKQDEPNALYKFSWLEPIAGLFHLQINILSLFQISFWG